MVMREKSSDSNNQEMHDNYNAMNHPEGFSYDKSLRPSDSHARMRPNANMQAPIAKNSIEIRKHPGPCIMIEIIYCIALQEGQNVNYYQEYCRLFIANVVLTTQMKELVAEKGELINKLAKLEKNEPVGTPAATNGEETADDKKRRFRRVATEIDRHYQCPVENCQKSYGSEGSLNQHLKLKHPELSKDSDLQNKSSKKDSDCQQQHSETSK